MKKNPYPGKFIVFEGLDGSGQTTQAKSLVSYLKSRGFEAILTKEPTPDSEAGRKIRKILDKKSEVSPERFQELFAKDREEHLERLIIPALKRGEIVISDRYAGSSFAYGIAEEVDPDYLISLNKKFLEPDLIILLKVSPEVCSERIEKRGEEKTLFEREKQLERVWKAYEKLAKRFKNVIIVDGERPIEEIAEDIKKIINQKLGV